MLNFNTNMGYPQSLGFPAFGTNQLMGGQMNPMMSSFAMVMQGMMSVMMGMMSQLMNAHQAMSMCPASFGQGMPGGLGMPGSPLNGFLGGGVPSNGNFGGGSTASGTGGTNGSQGAGSLYNGPAGTVGNVNVEKLVNAIDPGYRKSARQHWPAIVAEANKQGITNKAQLAYILATTVHESGAGTHMQEIASGSAYEGRRDLGNTQSGDGVRYKGRGYVQITGRNNYRDWGKRLGMDLVGNPSLAERPEVAAKILVGGMKMGTFTGKKLDDYINGSKTDFAGARRIVNGTDKAGTFAQTAQKILAAMG